MSSEPVLRATGEPDLLTTDTDQEVPPAAPEAAFVRTLLWTAATERPLDEVAALVELLKRSDEIPNPGDEALRVAAVVRPVSELRQLITLLNEPPHTPGAAASALRAAAVGRSVEEVAQLMVILGRTGADDVAAGSTNGHGGSAGADSHAGAGPETVLRKGPSSSAPPREETESATAAPVRRATASGSTAPDESSRAGRHSSYRTGEQAGNPTPQHPAHAKGKTLRTALRRLAAMALAACGMAHLLLGLAPVRIAVPTDAPSLTVTVVCLLGAVWLAVRDTVPAWLTSATAATGVIVLHVLSEVGVLDALRNVQSGVVTSSAMAAVGFAVMSAVLTGAALLLQHPRRVQASAAGAQ